MAVNQLKQFLRLQKILDPLVSYFATIFCNFLKQEREGMNTPRDKINEALEFVEAIHLDYDCDCVRRDDKLKIVKAISNAAPVNRKTTADNFFEKHFTSSIFLDSEKYYRNWVDTKGLMMSASD